MSELKQIRDLIGEVLAQAQIVKNAGDKKDDAFRTYQEENQKFESLNSKLFSLARSKFPEDQIPRSRLIHSDGKIYVITLHNSTTRICVQEVPLEKV